MKGLEAVVVVLLADGGESTEVAVVVEPLLDEDALAGDGRFLKRTAGTTAAPSGRRSKELSSLGELRASSTAPLTKAKFIAGIDRMTPSSVTRT